MLRARMRRQEQQLTVRQGSFSKTAVGNDVGGYFFNRRVGGGREFLAVAGQDAVHRMTFQYDCPGKKLVRRLFMLLI